MASMEASRAFETARLAMRPHVRADFDESAAMWGDERVTRHIGGRPSTREESWSRLLRCVGHWSLFGYGYFVVREKASGRYVGEVGVAHFEREMDPPLGNVAEAGWVLAPWAHGQGFATEAVVGVLGWLEASVGVTETVCIVDVSNLPSLRVAEKCGYGRLRETTYKGDAIVVLGRAGAVAAR
jgi:RimJ/RimL family protein N-acetyltransferase